MSDVRKQLEALAQRGTPRGAAAVLDAARGAASIEAERRPVDLDDDSLAVEPVSLSEARQRRSPWQRGIAIIGVAALVGVGSMVFASLNGGGGAKSPEAAVERLADAISHEDPLAAVDILAPDEVRSLHDSLDTASKRAAELKLVDQAGSPLKGVDLEISGLELDAQEVAAGFAKVAVHNGTATADVDENELSDLLRDDEWTRTADAQPRSLADLADDMPTFVMAVKDGDGWYVSPAYTALEYVRVANDLPAADFGSGREHAAELGAESPEAATRALVDALSTGDIERAVSLAPPTEIPLYDYRAALVQLAQQEGTKFGYTVDEFKASSEVDGDTASVAVSASGTYDDGTWILADDCLLVVDTELSTRYRTGEGEDPSYTNGICPSAELTVFPYVRTEDGRPTDSGLVHIETVRRDGRWFVSPVATALTLLDDWVGHIDSRTINSYLGNYDQLPIEGEIVAGKKLTYPDDGVLAHAYSFQGHQGQRIVGAMTFQDGSNEYGGGTTVPVIVYGPDGKFVDAAPLEMGGVFTLPADGEYRFVLRSGYGSGVMFWNYEDAPADIRELADTIADSYADCHQTPSGGMDCSSSGFEGTTDDSEGTCVETSDGGMECTQSATPSPIESSSTVPATTPND